VHESLAASLPRRRFRTTLIGVVLRIEVRFAKRVSLKRHNVGACSGHSLTEGEPSLKRSLPNLVSSDELVRESKRMAQGERQDDDGACGAGRPGARTAPGHAGRGERVARRVADACAPPEGRGALVLTGATRGVGAAEGLARPLPRGRLIASGGSAISRSGQTGTGAGRGRGSDGGAGCRSDLWRKLRRSKDAPPAGLALDAAF
jgi:hypothetical protein